MRGISPFSYSSSWLGPSPIEHGRYLHRPRLPSSGLPISEYSTVEACDDSYISGCDTIENGLGDVIVNGYLSGVRCKHPVETELVLIIVATNLPHSLLTAI